MTDIVEELRNGPFLDMENLVHRAADEIERLRAENFSLAAWQCEFTDGKTGLVAGEGGSTYCAMAKENASLLAANRDVMLHWEVLKADYERQRAALRDIADGKVIEIPYVQTIARAALEDRT